MRTIKKQELGMCKKLEIHAYNSKTGIRYVRKSWKHMRTIQKQELGMYNKSDNTYL